MKHSSESTCVMARSRKMTFIKGILLHCNLQCHCYGDTIDICSALKGLHSLAAHIYCISQNNCLLPGGEEKFTILSNKYDV